MNFEKTSDGKYNLDVKGYVCPHPQIYTKKALEKENVRLKKLVADISLDNAILKEVLSKK